MTVHQRLFAVLASVSLLLIILVCVYKRKIKEEYSWLWLMTGVIILLLAVWYDFLLFISKLIGAVSPQTTLFIFGLIFIIFINIHFSIKISHFSGQIKELVQSLAILTKQVNDLSKEAGK